MDQAIGARENVVSVAIFCIKDLDYAERAI